MKIRMECFFIVSTLCFATLLVLLYVLSPPPIISATHLPKSRLLFPIIPLTTSSMHCMETGPYYRDDSYTDFNLPDELRTTCLFSDVIVDTVKRRFVFVTENGSTMHIPPLSIMGRNTEVQCPQAFPSSFWEYSTLPTEMHNSSRVILTVVSRTYATHHGHTLFDGVLSIWLALARHNMSVVELAARTIMVVIADGKGKTIMDDRFSLLTPRPLLLGGFDDIFSSFGHSRYVRIERMVLGLAGFGWAFSPSMASWRGQQLRSFRSHALRQIHAMIPLLNETISILIVERVQHSSLNFFARSIVEADRVWRDLKEHVHDPDVVWKHVFFEGMSLADQMNVVQHADIVITIEGCAMENLPFFRDGTALIGLQYNRIWQHYDHLGTKHFIEYAEIAHIMMVDTWIDPQFKSIENTGGNFPIHVYDDLLRNAVVDAISLVKTSRLHICRNERCGSLRRYTPDRNVTVLIPPLFVMDGSFKI